MLSELRALPATQDRILFMLWNYGDSNLKGSQIFDISEIWAAIFDKTFGLLDCLGGLVEEVIQG